MPPLIRRHSLLPGTLRQDSGSGQPQEAAGRCPVIMQVRSDAHCQRPACEAARLCHVVLPSAEPREPSGRLCTLTLQGAMAAQCSMHYRLHCSPSSTLAEHPACHRWVLTAKAWVAHALPERVLASDVFPATTADQAFDDVTQRAAIAVTRLAQSILAAPRSPEKVVIR